MTLSNIFRGVLIAAALLLIAACQSAPSGDPAQTTLNYLQARVESNLDKMINLSCGTWEAQARVEATSFRAMQAELDGVTCEVSGTADGNTLVKCAGKIVTSYNGETREWALDENLFVLSPEGGEWRVCGYQRAGASGGK
jgi:hypothetical protein